jgi:hypothetical protein
VVYPGNAACHMSNVEAPDDVTGVPPGVARCCPRLWDGPTATAVAASLSGMLECVAPAARFVVSALAREEEP